MSEPSEKSLERARDTLRGACGYSLCLKRIAAAIDEAVREEREACENAIRARGES